MSWKMNVADTISKLVPRASGAANSTSLKRTIGDAMLGGIRDTLEFSADGASITNALKQAYTQGDNMRWGRVAGTASMLGIGWRFASGGGIYRDKNGNFDIAGIPFI